MLVSSQVPIIITFGLELDLMGFTNLDCSILSYRLYCIDFKILFIIYREEVLVKYI